MDVKLLAIFLLLAVFSFSSHAYRVCDNNAKAIDEDEVVADIAKLLMKTRNTDWAWASAKTAFALQVSLPLKFFARSKTNRAMKERLKLTPMSSLSLEELSYYAIAAKAMCQNPRRFGGSNLAEEIRSRMANQFSAKGLEPKAGYRVYGLGLSAMCVSGLAPSSYLVNRLLAGKNDDGSFGKTNPAQNTANLLEALHCVAGMDSGTYNKKSLAIYVRDMRKYLKRSDSTSGGKTYIGGVEGSGRALIALYKTKLPDQSPMYWSCSAVSRSLGMRLSIAGNITANLEDMLLRLRPGSILDLLPASYKCIRPEGIPRDYTPNCTPAPGMDPRSCITDFVPRDKRPIDAV